MNLFRSEEHIEAWLTGRPGGVTLPVSELSRLAEAWWEDRLAPEWRPRRADQSQAILNDLGLTGPFWRLD
jgi:hypothetical protein